jgi:hypothetical protein
MEINHIWYTFKTPKNSCLFEHQFLTALVQKEKSGIGDKQLDNLCGLKIALLKITFCKIVL